MSEPTDIVERLRDHAEARNLTDYEVDCAEAADEIERLRIENNKLRAALEGNTDWGAAFTPEDIGLVKVNNNSNVNWPWYRYPAPDDAVF